MRTRTACWVVLSAALVASGICAWAARLEHTLVADDPAKDFGVLRQGAEAAVCFRLTNRSFRAIEIDSVLPNCECAEVDVFPKHLAPFTDALVRGKWKLGNRRGPSETSLFVSFKSTPEGPGESLTLSLRAAVTPDIAFSPNRLEFSSAAAGERTLAFMPLAGSGVEVLSANTTYSAFRAQLLGREHKVVVTFDPSRWPHDGSPPQPRLVLRTTSQAEPHVAVELAVTNAD